MIRILKNYSLIRHIYFNKTEVEKVLILSCLFGVALSFARVVYTGELMFLSLIWNLFLAFIPFCISKFLARNPHWIEHSVKFVLTGIVWLLFIPNSFYIITDLFHLQERPDIPMWFDLALIFSFAWNGLIMGILSLRQMEKIIEAKWQLNTEPYFIYPFMFLNSFGIYLGRYLRYNSWDVLSNPFGLAQDVFYLLVHPVRHRFDWSMIICYAIFMSLLYLTLKKIGKELNTA